MEPSVIDFTKDTSTTKTVTFYGSSDDNFCYSDPLSQCDEIGCFCKLGCAIIKSPSTGEGLAVIGAYVLNGTWSMGVAQLDEDAALPQWKIDFTWEGYTTMIHIDVPLDVTVELSAFDPKD
jgi:hypothetical protein